MKSCDVCHDLLSLADQLRGLLRREPLPCRFQSLTGQQREVLGRWLCDRCTRRWVGRTADGGDEPTP